MQIKIHGSHPTWKVAKKCLNVRLWVEVVERNEDGFLSSRAALWIISVCKKNRMEKKTPIVFCVNHIVNRNLFRDIIYPIVSNFVFQPPWKHQKTEVFSCFRRRRGVCGKGSIEKKWIEGKTNTHLGCSSAVFGDFGQVFIGCFFEQKVSKS